MAASKNRGKRTRTEVEEAKGSSLSTGELTILKEVCEAHDILQFL